MGVQDRSRRWALGCGGLLTALAGLWGSAGCDNGATGEEACREIETARCRVVVGCPNSPVQTEEDIELCELHYRDQCMFGMADSLNPDQPAVTGCVNAINQARGCWDAGQTMGECNTAAEEAGVTGPALVTGYGPDLTGCDAIMFPEILVACSFMLPEQPEAEEATGGSGG
jgi:hypothetical protein